MDVAKARKQNNFVLVHGICHGAWCWYKLKPLLESAGHRVTAIDLSASGINMKPLHEIYTLSGHSIPLMELMAAIPATEKVVLVGHSFGGFNLALAMDQYPEKISVAVFIAAMMPDTTYLPSFLLDKYFESSRKDMLLDCQIASYGSEEQPGTSLLLGHQFLAFKVYQECSAEDLELAKLLVRPTSMFREELSKRKPFSTEGYGSVKRVYIICDEDKGAPTDFQRWIVQSSGTTQVKEMKDAGHMPMLSKRTELCQSLLEIADKYS